MSGATGGESYGAEKPWLVHAVSYFGLSTNNQEQVCSNVKFGAVPRILLSCSNTTTVVMVEMSVGGWVGIALALLFVTLAVSHYFFNSKFIDVKGRVYLVTGGSSGIGKAVAQVSWVLFPRHGCPLQAAHRHCWRKEQLSL